MGYLSSGSLEKDLVVQFKYSSADLNDKEKAIVFYLVGYVFSTFSRTLRFTQKNNQNSPKPLHEYLAILAGGKLGDERQELPGYKLVDTKNRGRSSSPRNSHLDLKMFCKKKSLKIWQNS